MSVPLLFKVMIFGEPEALKQELAKKYMTGSFIENTKMTTGFDFNIKVLIINQQKVTLQIWDFGGQEHFASILPMYVRGTKGALLIYDVANKSTLNKIDDWLETIRSNVERDIPIILVGFAPRQAEYREVSLEEGMNMAKSKGITVFIECNVRTGENVEEIFVMLTKLILKKFKH